MAGAGAGGDLPTGEMSTEKELFNAINPGKTLEKFTKLLKGYSGDWAALAETWSEAPLKEDTLSIRAARNNCVDILNHLLSLKAAACEKRALANQSKLSNGATPLYIAAQNGHLEVVNALIAAGAAVDQACHDDWTTPLFIASQHGHTDVVKALIAANAALNQACTSNLATPLFIASQNGHLTVVEALINAGASLDQMDIYNETPLLVAIRKAHTAIVAMLLEEPEARQRFSPLRAAWISAVARTLGRARSATAFAGAGAGADHKRPCIGPVKSGLS